MQSDGQDFFAQQGRESAVVLGDEGLDVVEAVVALREDEQQPNGQNLAWRERPFPVARHGKVTVQRGRQVQTLERAPQDRQVGKNFDTQQAGFGGAHPSVLPTSPFPENHHGSERTAGNDPAFLNKKLTKYNPYDPKDIAKKVASLAN